MGRFFVSGIFHFATGYDHALFLLSLLLPIGLVPRKEGQRAALRDAFWLVTAFTVGHNLTLAVATLAIVPFPSKPVEAMIAASIVASRDPQSAKADVARAGARPRVRIRSRARLRILERARRRGLPTESLVGALVAFNAGIEVAQLVFVAAVAVPLRWAARYSTYDRIVIRGGSVVIAVLGLLFLVERLAA